MKPISDIDIEKKVDFEYNKKPYAKDSETTYDPNKGKLLVIKSEGVNRVYKLDIINSKENKISVDLRYITISVILVGKKIRIYNDYEFIEFDVGDEYKTTFETKLDTLFENINNFGEKTVFLNIFILENSLNDNKSVAKLYIDEHDQVVYNKLGFVPDNLLHKHKNVKLFVHNLADSCVLYNLYQREIDNHPTKTENLVHIHFDRYASQTTFYMEGVVNDKITGFFYDKSKSLLENVNNVVEFAVKISVIFGSFEMGISYTDIDEM